MQRVVFVALVTVASVGSRSLAHAQGAASAEADALFDRGRELMDKKQYAEACTAFAASNKIAPATSTILNEADCREKNKQLATAYGLFRDAERGTRAPLDEATQKLNRLALSRAKAIEPRISKLTIDVPQDARIAGLEVLRNGALVDPLVFGQALPVDGGEYTILARAPSHESTTTRITIASEKDFKTVTLTKLVEKEKEVLPAGTSTTASNVITPGTPAGPPSKTLPFIVGGGGVAFLLGGLGLELWAQSQYDDSKVEPDDIKQESLWQGARTKRYLAQGFAVVGLAGVGVGVWLFIRARNYETPPPGEVAIEPSLTQDSAGFIVRGGF
jgi:hypothetical protein